MNNAKLKSCIRKAKVSTETIAQKLGIRRSTFYYKLSGDSPWHITELLEVARMINLTKEEFLDIIEFDETKEEQ